MLFGLITSDPINEEVPPSGASLNIGDVIGVEIICTDESCAVTVDISVESLEHLHLLACDDCGCTTQVLAVWEVVELRPAAPVTTLRRTPPPLAA